MIKIVIFDMDGVLFDTILFARREFLKLHPGMTAEEYNEIHAGNFHHKAAKYSHLKINQTEEEKLKQLIEYAEQKSRSELFPEIKELLDSLRNADTPIVLNTNAFERNCLPLLENAKIKDYFDFIASAEISKDKIEKFKLIEERYGISNDQMVFITDALGDVRDADQADVQTIAVTWGVHDKAFFNRETHNNVIAIVDTVSELHNILFNLIGPGNRTNI